MTSTPQSPRSRNSVDPVVELVDSVKQYAKQETVDPIRGAARWVAVGTVASVSMGLALVFFSLAILRLTQDLGATALDGAWSFVPYIVTLVIVMACVGVSISRIQQRTLTRGE